MKVGIVGDFNPENRFHQATNAALQHAVADVEITWIGTSTLGAGRADQLLAGLNGIWAAPSSPYQSMEGALKAIHWARTSGVPFTGS
jgi:CTP synthase (UTP-ammonia lyase)